MNYPKEYWKFYEENSEMIYAFDIETTGLNCWSNEMITLSMGAYSLKERTLVDEIEIEFRPEFMNKWDDGAEKIHGITRERAIKFPPREEGRKKLLSFLDFYKLKLPQLALCHALNVKGQGLFDYNFLFAEFFKVDQHYDLYRYWHDTQSTITFAQDLKKNGRVDFVNNKLNTITQHFNIELNHHNAKSDREACMEIYWRFLDL